MDLTDEQRTELESLVKPLIKWINDNCHPHVQVLVDCDSGQVSELLARFVTTEFIKD